MGDDGWGEWVGWRALRRGSLGAAQSPWLTFGMGLDAKLTIEPLTEPPAASADVQHGIAVA